MIAATVACTLARLAACERDLMACTATSLSGSWAAALRYIDLARQMLEAAEVSAIGAGPGLLSGSATLDSPNRTDFRAGSANSDRPIGGVSA
jgi:hypothetical protein